MQIQKSRSLDGRRTACTGTLYPRHYPVKVLFPVILLFLLLQPSTAPARPGTTLDAIEFAIMPGDRVRIVLVLSAPVEEPSSFAIHDPARIALDLPGVSLNIPQTTREINVGIARSITAVEVPDRTRVVIQLIRMGPYTIESRNHSIHITIDKYAGADTVYYGMAETSRIENITFARNADNTGRVLVTLSDHSAPIDTRRRGKNIIVTFKNTSLPENLDRVLDVTDFATPILTIDTYRRGNDTEMVITTTGNYDYLAYQTRNRQTMDIKPTPKRKTNG